jgi:hypothetical protein
MRSSLLVEQPRGLQAGTIDAFRTTSKKSAKVSEMDGSEAGQSGRRLMSRGGQHNDLEE